MKRVIVTAAALAAVGFGVEPIAWGHGGIFRGPGGSVPPTGRVPSDPTPPPPPPQTGQPTTPPDGPAPTGPVTPGSTPDGGKPTTPTEPGLGAPPGRPRNPTTTPDSWTYWWAYEQASLLRLKEEIYRLHGSPGAAFGGDLGPVTGNRSAATRATEKRVREEVVPALLRAMDPGTRQHPDTRSAAYLALAKVTDEPSHLDRLLSGVYRDDGTVNADEDVIVRESAALSLGLLRRTEPSRRFDAKTYDRARDAAFRIFGDDRLATRTRAFAMLAVGLLGDQPSERGAAAPTGAAAAGGGAPAAARIFELLHERGAPSDLPVALLVALSLQSAADVTPEMLDALQECAVRGRLFRAERPAVVCAYAAEALGRLGGADHARPLLLAATLRTTPIEVQQSAATALRGLVRRLEGADRAALAWDATRASDAARDRSTRCFLAMVVAEALSADAERGRTDVLEVRGGAVLDWLARLVADGNYVVRPYAALGAGLVSRAVGERPDVVAWGLARERLCAALRGGLDDRRLDGRGRGAFAIGLGLAREDAARRRLAEITAAPAEDRELRGYAAVALGMIGQATPEVVRAVEGALAEDSSEELRVQCATSLGLLGVPEAVDLLLARLDASQSLYVQGQVVMALGRIGDARALRPLTALLQDPVKPDLVRAMACAGLGLVGDLEPVPSLARISTGHDWLLPSDALAEVLTIL